MLKPGEPGSSTVTETKRQPPNRQASAPGFIAALGFIAPADLFTPPNPGAPWAKDSLSFMSVFP